jgi:hypothetical protein
MLRVRYWQNKGQNSYELTRKGHETGRCPVNRAPEKEKE